MKSVFIALGLSTLAAALPSSSSQAQLVAKLKESNTQLAKQDLLDKPGDWRKSSMSDN